MPQCADTSQKMSLERGGDAPFIGFDDTGLISIKVAPFGEVQ